MGLAICTPCATGNCARCNGTVHRRRTTGPCACRHGAEIPVASPSDPRHAGGAIIGVDDNGAALLDTTRAVLVDDVQSALTANPSDGRPIVGLFLAGRINRTPERSAILHVFGPDSAAAIVADLVVLARRAGGTWGEQFDAELAGRLAAVGADQ